jgi:hypothetical protein
MVDKKLIKYQNKWFTCFSYLIIIIKIKYLIEMLAIKENLYQISKYLLLLVIFYYNHHKRCQIILLDYLFINKLVINL